MKFEAAYQELQSQGKVDQVALTYLLATIAPPGFPLDDLSLFLKAGNQLEKGKITQEEYEEGVAALTGRLLQDMVRFQKGRSV